MLLKWVVCSSLNSIDLSSFKINNVTNMSNIFSGCYSIESIDLSSFNTNNATKICFMFYGCSSLKKENIKLNKKEKIILDQLQIESDYQIS